jgi:hypothetical protein
MEDNNIDNGIDLFIIKNAHIYAGKNPGISIENLTHIMLSEWDNMNDEEKNIYTTDSEEKIQITQKEMYEIQRLSKKDVNM